MTPRHRLTIALCAAAALAALPVLAQGRGDRHRGPGHHGPGPGGMDAHRLEHLALRLELSDGQREALSAAFEARLEAGAAVREELFAARRALDERIHAESFDEAAIREAAATVAALEVDRAVERARQVQKMREILTPEQLAELERMRGERQRFGRRGPRGPGHGLGLGGPPPAGE